MPTPKKRAAPPAESPSKRTRRKTPPLAAGAFVPPDHGPLAQIFGVRHLSPGSAWHVARFIDRVQPTAILIEGPSDANLVNFIDPKTKETSRRRIFDFFVHRDLKPPFAMLCFARPPEEENVLDILYPFAVYSPEFVAAVAGVRAGAHVSFMDLPAAVFLGLSLERARRHGAAVAGVSRVPPAPVAPKVPTTLSPTADAYIADPWRRITELSGEEDVDAWWERWFEHLEGTDAYRHSIFQLGVELIRSRGPTDDPEQELTLRERYMRRSIRDAIAAGHDPARIVVVCGAEHAPRLTADEEPMADEELASLPTVETTITMMPYSYRRMSSQYGAGAGNKAPRYFEMIWQAYNANQPREVGATYLAEVARTMRTKGRVHATANVIEAVRLAEALAAMNEANAPALQDLQQGAVATLAAGDPTLLRDVFDVVEIGNAMGAVPDGVPRTALQLDFYAQARRFRLDKYLAEDAAAKTQRDPHVLQPLEIQGQDLTHDREAHFFLSRTNLLEVGWATPATGQKPLLRYWKFAWGPDVETRIAEASLLGNSVEEAALRKFDQLFAAAQNVGDITTLAEKARDCDLGNAVSRSIRRAEELLLSDRDFGSLARGLASMVSLATNRGVLDVDTDRAVGLAQAIYFRLTSVLGDVAVLGPPANAKVVEQIKRVQWEIATREARSFLDVNRWNLALDEVAENSSGRFDGKIAGTAAAILLAESFVSPRDQAAGLGHEVSFERRVTRWLSPSNQPAQTAAWFEGLIGYNPSQIINREHIWRAMNEFVERIDDQSFNRLVVALRRACSALSADQIRRVSAMIAAMLGIAPEELTVKTKRLEDEMEDLRRELLGDLT